MLSHGISVGIFSRYRESPCTQLEETSKDENGESERVEGIDYLEPISMTLRESVLSSFACSNRGE